VKWLAGTLCLAGVLAGGCSNGHSASQSNSSPKPVSPVRSIFGSPDPRELELSDLVPARARIVHVWFVPGGSRAPEVVVGWSYRGRHVTSAPSDRRYAMTVWQPDHVSPASVRWRPKTLFKGSPFPLSWRSVRTADVTGDGHRDLLVTVECNVCNHAAAVASVYADVGNAMRKRLARSRVVRRAARRVFRLLSQLSPAGVPPLEPRPLENGQDAKGDRRRRLSRTAAVLRPVTGRSRL
jgi:hypothetical protein